MALEKSLQSLIEKHLDTFLRIPFLASEFWTVPKTGEYLALAKAFRGKFVTQHPNNKPASALPERLREPQAATPLKPGRKKPPKRP